MKIELTKHEQEVVLCALKQYQKVILCEEKYQTASELMAEIIAKQEQQD